MRRGLLAVAVCASLLLTLMCIAFLHSYPNLTIGTIYNRPKHHNASLPQYLTEQINQKDETIAKLLLEIDNLRSVNQKHAGELKVTKGPESSSHSGGADSNSALSLFGLHGVRVMPFCNESDGSFLPPLVSSIQASLSSLHLFPCLVLLCAWLSLDVCRRAKIILMAMLNRCFRLHTR
jgi:hypothetical protein